MKYIKRKLTIEKVSVETIAKKFGTPTYCYSYGKLKDNINNFKRNFKTNIWNYNLSRTSDANCSNSSRFYRRRG